MTSSSIVIRNFQAGSRSAFRAAGKNTEAQAAYRAVLDSFPKSFAVTEAKVRLAELTDGKM